MADTAIKQLVQRIENALKSDIGGHEAAKLAWAYSNAVAKVNDELVTCADLFSNDNSVEAYLKMRTEPRLLDRMESLAFSGLAAWNECCAFFGWRKSEALKEDLAIILKESFEELENPKEILIAEFRRQHGGRDSLSCVPALRLLCSEYPKEKDYAVELKRLQESAIEQLNRDLGRFSDFEANSSEVKRTVSRFQNAGFGQNEGGKEFSEAERFVRTQEANSLVNEFLDESESYSIDADWLAFERAFFACDCMVDDLDAQDLIDPEYQKSLNEMSSRLYSIRGSYEVNLQIQNTLEMSAGRKRQKKLDRLLAHANVMGYHVDEPLQEQLAVSENKSDSKTGNKIIVFLGFALPVAIAGFWIYHGIQNPPSIDASETVAASDVIDIEPEEGKGVNSEEVTLATRDVVEESSADSPVVDAEKTIPEKKIVVKRVPLDDRYLALLADFSALVESEYHFENDEKRDQILEATKEFANIDQDDYHDVGIQFAALSSEYVIRKEKRIQELTTLADYSVLAAKKSSETLVEATSEEDLSNKISDVETSLNNAFRAVNAVKKVDPTFIFDGLSGAEESLDEAKASLAFLMALRQELAECRSVDSYYSLLGGFADYDFISQDETNHINAALSQKVDLEASLQDLVMPNRDEDWERLTKTPNFVERSVMPSSDELQRLMELSNEPVFNSVYVSKFRYYQGGYEPQGERLVYLAEPIVRIGEDRGTSANLTFKEYGFDEEGLPHSKPRNLNFIRRPSGEVFGFYYDDSELSPESQFFVDKVKSEIEEIMSGAPRVKVLELLDMIADANDLPPSLRGYWTLALLEIVELDEFKWGVEFSPTLQLLSTAAKNVAGEGLSRHTWLSAAERRSPSLAWSSFFEDYREADPIQEVLALGDLMSFSAQGALVQVGYFDMEGKLRFTNGRRDDEPLWTYNRDKNELELVRETDVLDPYSIVLAYKFEEGGIKDVKAKAIAKHGVDLNHVRFEELLPPLFKY